MAPATSSTSVPATHWCPSSWSVPTGRATSWITRAGVRGHPPPRTSPQAKPEHEQAGSSRHGSQAEGGTAERLFTGCGGQPGDHGEPEQRGALQRQQGRRTARGEGHGGRSWRHAG